MKNGKNYERTNIGTYSKSLLRRLYDKLQAVFCFDKFAVRLRGESTVLYPGMSRSEIKHVAAAICRAAVKNAK